MKNNAASSPFYRRSGKRKPVIDPNNVDDAVRAILYARVSTDDQGKDGKVSLDAQLDRCREYAEKKGFNVVAEFKEDFTGKKHRRPELDKVMEMFQEGQGDVLIVMSNDRFHRKVSVFYILWEELKEYGAELHFSDRGMVDESNLGSMILTGIENVMSEAEAKKIVDRMIGAKYEMVSNGVPMIADPAYGYNKDGVNQWVLDPVRAPWVKFMFDMITYGRDGQNPVGLRALCRYLNENGVPTSDHKSWKKRHKTGQWLPTTLSKVLRNPVYCGHYFFGVPPQEVLLPPELHLVTEEQWQMAQEQLEKNRSICKRPKKYDYPLGGGYFKCACGRSMVGTCVGTPYFSAKTGERLRYRRYACIARSWNEQQMADRPCLTRKKTVAADQCELVVTEWLKWVLAHPDDLKAGLEAMVEHRKSDRTPIQARYNSTLAAIETCEQNIQAYIQDKKTVLHERTKARYDALVAQEEQVMEQLNETLHELQAELNDFSVAEANLERISDLAEKVVPLIEGDDITIENFRFLLDLFKVQVVFHANPEVQEDRWLEIRWAFTDSAFYKLSFQSKTHQFEVGPVSEGEVRGIYRGIVNVTQMTETPKKPKPSRKVLP